MKIFEVHNLGIFGSIGRILIIADTDMLEAEGFEVYAEGVAKLTAKFSWGDLGLNLLKTFVNPYIGFKKYQTHFRYDFQLNKER